MAEMDAARLVKGSVYLVTQSVVTTIIGAVALAFITRMLTQAEIGVTVALTLTLGIAQVLSDLGFSGGLTKYVAEYRGKGADYTTISYGAVLMKTLTAGSAAVLCVLIAPSLSGFLLKSGEFALLFQLLSINLLAVCFSTTVNHLLLGLNMIKEMVIFNVISAFIGKMSGVGFLVCGFGLVGLVVGWILGGLAYIFLGVLFTMRNGHVRIHPIGDVIPYLKMLASFSWPLFITNMVTFLYNWFDRVLLLTYLPLSEVAVYNVALRAFDVLSVIPVALGNTLLPYYSEQYGKDEQQKIAACIFGTSRYIALLYTPLALGLMVTANPAITLFAGSAYASGDLVLAILCFFSGLGGLVASFAGLLLVYSMTPKVLLINIVSVAGSSVVAPFLLPFFGVVGMAVIKGIAMIISLVLTAIALHRRIPIRFDREALWKSWCAALVMFVAVWFVERIHYSPYLLPLYVIVGGTVYMIITRLLRTVNKNDLKLIRNLLGKRATVITDTIEKVLI